MKYPMITYEITYELSFVTDRYVIILMELSWFELIQQFIIIFSISSS